MDRNGKEQLVASFKELLSSVNLAVVVHYKGLNVAEMTELRQKVSGLGAELKVTKNSLAKIAASDTKFEKIADFLSGPTALAVSVDSVAAAKAIVEFAKDNEKLEILGGVLDEQVIDVAGVKTLASLPSLDELRAKIISIISTPATRIAGVLQAPPAQLARVLSAYAAKGDA